MNVTQIAKEIFEQEIKEISKSEFDEIDLQNLISHYIFSVYGDNIENHIITLYNCKGRYNAEDEQIADEVFEMWDDACCDEDFYDNCMESICDIIGHTAGPIPDQAYIIWEIINEKYL